MDADTNDCMTECATACDLHTHHLDDCYDYFVRDESFNEKGGKKMKKAHNEKATEEVVSCAPQPGYDLGDKEPTLDDLDLNKDGVIEEEEAIEFGARACITDEIIRQIFSEADLNQDKVISKDEFASHGENTVQEKAIDDALEKVSEGDDETNTVQSPDMTEFDKNDDGALDKEEAKDAIEHELAQRTEHEEVPEETMKELEPEIEKAIDKVDTNDDGEIDADEYAAEADPEGLGNELKEAQDADEDKKEIDDLPRATAAPAVMIQQRRMLRHSHRHY